MTRLAIPILLLTAALLACGGGEAPATDPSAPRAGLWEVRTEYVSSEGFAPDIAAEMAALMPEPLVERQCFGAPRPVAAGDPAPPDSRCTYSRVADSGSRAERDAVCQNGHRIEWRGTRSADAYDYRIVTRSRQDPAGPPRSVVTRERGRRLGECPQSSSRPLQPLESFGAPEAAAA